MTCNFKLDCDIFGHHETKRRNIISAVAGHTIIRNTAL